MKHLFTSLLLVFFCCSLFAHTTGTFAAPTIPATNFNVSSADGDRITLGWTSGNGARRIIIARKDAAVTAVPVNGINYTAGAFGAGNEVAPGEFVVYNSNAATTTVTGLLAATNYHFAIFEYNGSGASIEYLTTATTRFASTLSAPPGQVTNFVIDNINGHSMRLSWTNPVSGSAGSGRIVIAREGGPVNVNPIDLASYVASSVFGNGTEIGTGNFVVFKSSSNSLTVDDLKPGTMYHFAVFEYSGSNGLVFNINNPPVASATTLPRPTQPATGITFSNIEGKSMSVTVTKGNGARRLMIVKQGSPVTFLPQDGVTYTANNAFGSGQEIAPGEFVCLNSTSVTTTLTNLSIGTTYHIAVFEYDGTGANTAYLASIFAASSQSTLAAPAIAPSSPVVSNLTNSAFTLTWQNGDGTRRLVVVRQGSPVNVLPVDLTSYAPSTIFGLGSNIQSSANYVVYANTGNTVTVTGLAAGSSYHFAIFEYNGSSSPVYLTSSYATGSFTTSIAPSNPASALMFTNVEGNRMSVQWTNGNGARRILVVKAGSPVTGIPADNITYSASTSFGSGDEIAPGEYVVYNSNGANLTILNLAAATTYHFAVFEYNIVGSNIYYLTSSFAAASRSTMTAPVINASNLIFSNITGNSMKLTWTNGGGGRRLILAKAVSPVDAQPADFSSYSDNSVFGSGPQIGTGNFVVYAGNGSNVTVTGLNPDVVYHYQVFEYNGINYPVYLTAGALTGSQVTNPRPAVAASAMNFAAIEGNKLTVKWTNGNGARRMVVAKQGSPVTAIPVDGTAYTANTVFGNGQEIATGEFVVYNNTGTEVSLSALTPSVTYYFAVFEYDGTGTGARYLTSSFLSGNQATLSAPSQQATNVLFSSIGSTTVNVNWTVGDGSRHLVIGRKGAPVNVTPQDLVYYNSSSSFGSVSSVVSGDHFAIFNSTAATTSVSNLLPGTTYYFSVFEYNGFTGPIYNITNPATGSVTTLGPPAEPATSVVFNKLGNSALKIDWTNGSGQKRLVLVKANGPVDAIPATNVLYAANTFFGSGDEIGAGNYAVYSGPGNTVTINNLSPGVAYGVAVFEYNQFPTGPMYLTTTPAEALFPGFILPVKLISFAGMVNTNNNVLTWKTATEMNSKEYVIERSADNSVFLSIGTVTASGNSNTERTYTFEDINRIPAAYYRLRMVDIDGKTEFSKVIRLDVNDAARTTMQVFPAITRSTVTLNVQAPGKNKAAVSIIDMSGRIIRTETRQVEKGVNQFTLDVSALVNGTYIIQLLSGDVKLVQRIIKQ